MCIRDRIGEELSIGREKKVPDWFGKIGKYVYVPIAAIVFVLGVIYGGIG